MITRNSKDNGHDRQLAEASFRVGVQAYNDSELEQAAETFGEERKKMKAVRMHARGGPEQLFYEDAPQPQPAEGEVLVRVYATAVTPTELSWSTTWQTKAGADRHFPIPGHDLSGVVAQVGPGVTGVTVEMAVYALTDFNRDGAEAEYAIALPSALAPKPHTLDYVQAAAVPMLALTAWQALFDHADLSAGQSILIHGASGGVGTFAVQLAHWVGVHVMGTASARNRDYVRGLGADEFIDYTTTRFEDVVHDVDVVLDTVGGDTLERSWGVLRKGDILVSIVGSPAAEQAAAHGVRNKNAEERLASRYRCELAPMVNSIKECDDV